MVKTIKITEVQISNPDLLIRDMVKLGMTLAQKGHEISSMEGPFFDKDNSTRIYIVNMNLDRSGNGQE